MNPNVFYTLLFSFLSIAARSVFVGSSFTAYVYILTDSSASKVGYITGLMGCMNLVAGVMSGMFSDRYRRDTALFVASAVSLVAIVLSALALLTGTQMGNALHIAGNSAREYLYICVAFTVWGVFKGIYNPALQAIFADSVATGDDRTKCYTWKIQVTQLANALGPLISIILFATLGNTWTLLQCRRVLLIGLALHIPASLILTRFRDQHCLGQASDPVAVAAAVRRRQGKHEGAGAVADADAEAGGQQGRKGQQALEQPLLEATVEHGAENTEADVATETTLKEDSKHSSTIAHVMVAADVMAGLASGCAIKFFPIFFLEHLKMSPLAVSAVYLASPLATAVLAKQARRLSKTAGRIGVAVLYKLVGVSLLLFIAVAPWSGDLLLWRHILVAAYVARTALMNSTQGLVKAVLMDHVPKAQRGRYAAVENVKMFNWSGSAVLGGLLVNWRGMRANFVVTACAAFVGVLMLVYVHVTLTEQSRKIAAREQA